MYNPSQSIEGDYPAENNKACVCRPYSLQKENKFNQLLSEMEQLAGEHSVEILFEPRLIC